MTKTTLPPGVKATTGGTFDRDEHLIYFLAGDLTNIMGVPQPQVLIAVNELETKTALDKLDRLCDERAVLMDSGIFNLAMNHARKHNVSHDVGLSMAPEEIDGFEELWDRYASIVTRFADRLWGVIELDQGGVEHKPRTRARIETELGFTPMPVYHPLLDGWDYYDELASSYDRLCFGNLVKANSHDRQRLVWTAAERARDYPYLWTHLLGVTPNQNLLAHRFRGSADSSAWLTSLRWMATAWYGFTYLAAAGKYPSELWCDSDAHEGDLAYRDAYRKVVAMSSATAYFQHRMIRPLSEDSHPWL